VTCHSHRQGDTHLCTECTDCKVLKTTKHSWGVNFWNWVCGIAILSGYDCCIVIQASCGCSVYLAIKQWTIECVYFVIIMVLWRAWAFQSWGW
jgi:hypothetical protein